MINDLVDLAFNDASEAHKAHLATTSFAQHMALKEFYTDVVEAADTLTEALIAMNVGVPDAEPDMVGYLKRQYGALQAMRGICDGNPTAENLFDNLGAVYMSAIYKLERLK